MSLEEVRKKIDSLDPQLLGFVPAWLWNDESLQIPNLRKLGNLPLLGGNEVEILTDYNKSIDRLIEDINAAKTSVHLVYYIFYPDKTGRKVADALKAAARRDFIETNALRAGNIDV